MLVTLRQSDWSDTGIVRRIQACCVAKHCKIDEYDELIELAYIDIYLGEGHADIRGLFRAGQPMPS